MQLGKEGRPTEMGTQGWQEIATLEQQMSGCIIQLGKPIEITILIDVMLVM